MESNLSAFLSVTSKNRHWRKKKKIQTQSNPEDEKSFLLPVKLSR